MKPVRYLLSAVVAASILLAFSWSASADSEVLHGGTNGKAHVMKVKAAKHGQNSSSNLYYHGGVGGVGVETAPAVYVTFWGWSGGQNDPAHVAPYLQNFLTGVGGSAWLSSTTQYCQGVASGTYTCGTSGAPAGNPASILKAVWFDDTNPAPTTPTQTDLANEAIRTAAQFGNTTSGSNSSTQYVIATATQHNASGFGVQYCAWHSSVSSVYGNIAYTNLPYMPDAGASCGAGFVNAGNNLDGVSIVEGHELAETYTDQYPNGGWLDRFGSENGDKCAWISSGQGAAANVTLPTGTFAVQSLWSNAFNSNAGGCVQSYP